MLVPAEWGVLYPEQRGASTAGPAPTIVGRAMWEVKRGALGVGHEKSGLWWRKRLGKGQSQGAKSVKPPPPWNSLLWDGATKGIVPNSDDGYLAYGTGLQGAGFLS